MKSKDKNVTIETIIKRIEVIEKVLFQGKEVLNLEEAALFMGIARSSLYKMTHEQAIPFYKPNGKMVYFEKSELLNYMRKNRTASMDEIANEANFISQKLAQK